ncbi:MAG: phosphotransferase [Acidimicrobiia bacterium]
MTATHGMEAWAFPRHRPQMYAPSSRVLRAVPRYYSFGRQISKTGQLAVMAAVSVPGVRSLVAKRETLTLPFAEDTFEQMLREISEVVDQVRWAAFRSAWHTQRIILFSYGRHTTCTGVTHVTAAESATFHPMASGTVVRVPEVLGVRQIGSWEMRVEESLPPWHRAHPWDKARLTELIDDARSILVTRIDPSPQPDWVPIHGDLTPWNLRVDDGGTPWLIDWEWSGWGPEYADLLRFAIAHGSLSTSEPDELVAWLDRHLEVAPEPLAQAATYWLDHRMYHHLRPTRDPEEVDGIEAERENARMEATALQTLAARI